MNLIFQADSMGCVCEIPCTREVAPELGSLSKAQYLICLYLLLLLLYSARPANRQSIRDGVLCQTEVNPLMVLRNSVHSPSLPPYLHHTPGLQDNAGTDPITVRYRALQIDLEPMVPVALIAKELMRSFI